MSAVRGAQIDLARRRDPTAKNSRRKFGEVLALFSFLQPVGRWGSSHTLQKPTALHTADNNKETYLHLKINNKGAHGRLHTAVLGGILGAESKPKQQEKPPTPPHHHRQPTTVSTTTSTVVRPARTEPLPFRQETRQYPNKQPKHQRPPPARVHRQGRDQLNSRGSYDVDVAHGFLGFPHLTSPSPSALVLCVCVSLSLSVCLFVYLYLPLCVSLSPCVCLSLPLHPLSTSLFSLPAPVPVSARLSLTRKSLSCTCPRWASPRPPPSA